MFRPGIERNQLQSRPCIPDVQATLIRRSGNQLACGVEGRTVNLDLVAFERRYGAAGVCIPNARNSIVPDRIIAFPRVGGLHYHDEQLAA